MVADPGFFGPDSMMWRVNREMTVLFGGARALLMHAAHPLVAAGARQTGGYRRDPWTRLIHTLQMQNTVTFGTIDEAQAAADRINKLHRAINGTDPVTGRRYDALAPDLLLWVHAALEESSLMFYELTVGPLTDAERQQYHEENLKSAELMLLPADQVPQTYVEMRDYISDIVHSDELVMSDVAEEVSDLIRRGAVPWQIKPIWSFISFAAVGTLPGRLREFYGMTWGPRRQRVLDANLAFLRRVRPFIPDRYRLIMPARWAERRMAGDPSLRFDQFPRSA